MNESRLDVSVEAVKGLLIDAYNRYEKNFQDSKAEQFYWDGYIRALHHVLEMNGQ